VDFIERMTRYGDLPSSVAIHLAVGLQSIVRETPHPDFPEDVEFKEIALAIDGITNPMLRFKQTYYLAVFCCQG
jgi:hypothetical protein